MRLLINGVWCEFTPLKDYRATHQLPTEFGVSHFEPKDYSGLGKLDTAGSSMNNLRDRVLAATPRQRPITEWLGHSDTLQATFERELRYINPDIGLQEPEIEFAAAGFGDVVRAMVYAAVRGHANFDSVYAEWLHSSIKIASHSHDYGEGWQIQVISHAYGRIGLQVTRQDVIDYVVDTRLACPAEGFMLQLLRDVTSHIQPR